MQSMSTLATYSWALIYEDPFIMTAHFYGFSTSRLLPHADIVSLLWIHILLQALNVDSVSPRLRSSLLL